MFQSNYSHTKVFQHTNQANQRQANQCIGIFSLKAFQQGNAVKSALQMLAFGLGTLPIILAMGAG